MRRLLAFFLLGALSCASASAATYTDKATGLRFPDNLGPWKKTDVHQYPERGLGTSITYEHPLSGVVTLYIYDKGMKKIPTGGKSDVVRREFELVEQELETVYSDGKYEKLQKVLEAAPEVTSGDKAATLLASVYSYSNPAEHPPQRMTFALLTGYRNRFLKLRYTLPADVEKTPDRGQNELKQLITAFLKQNQKNAAAFWHRASKPQPAKITEEEALGALARFKEDPHAALQEGEVAKIINYSEAHPKVQIVIGEKQVPWIGKEKVDESRSLLLAAYIAGNTEAQLKQKRWGNDSYAGVRQAIATYRQIQQAQPGFVLAELEKLIRLEDEGKLRAHLEQK